MEETAALNQPNPTPTTSPSPALPLSSPPTLAYLLSLTPAVVVPYSTLRLIARSAAGESYRGHSHNQQSQPPQPSLSYHDYIARTSPSALSRLTARISVMSATQLFTLTNDATLIEEACSVSYIPLTSLRALPAIVHTLRQHIAFNQLYASCFRQSPTTRTQAATAELSDTSAAAVSVDVTAFPPHTLRLRISHPNTAAGQSISLDIRLAAGEPHEHCTQLPVLTDPTCSAATSAPPACFHCHIWSVQLDRSFDSVAPCSDSFALRVLSITQSVPALVHAVLSRAKQLHATGNTNENTAG